MILIYLIVRKNTNAVTKKLSKNRILVHHEAVRGHERWRAAVAIKTALANPVKSLRTELFNLKNVKM